MILVTRSNCQVCSSLDQYSQNTGDFCTLTLTEDALFQILRICSFVITRFLQNARQKSIANENIYQKLLLFQTEAYRRKHFLEGPNMIKSKYTFYMVELGRLNEY